MNLLIASGHLGGDPETRFSKTGTAITSFSLPVSQGWGDNEKTTWVKCVLFGKKGANQEHGMVPYLSKGKLVTVQGEIVLSEWEGKEGDKRSTLECYVRDLVVPKDSNNYKPVPAQDHAQPVTDDFEDDIPF